MTGYRGHTRYPSHAGSGVTGEIIANGAQSLGTLLWVKSAIEHHDQVPERVFTSLCVPGLTGVCLARGYCLTFGTSVRVPDHCFQDHFVTHDPLPSIGTGHRDQSPGRPVTRAP